MVKLRLVHSRIGEKIVDLADGAMIVGREGAQVDLSLDWDARISRRHAQLSVENGVVFVEDLGSKNGTWEGESRITSKTAIAPSRPVIIGETLFALAPGNPLDDMMAAYVAGTDDLAPPPAPPPPPPPIRSAPTPAFGAAPPLKIVPETKEGVRSHPRFVTEKKIGVRIAERSALKTMWTENISKGGLFVRTDTPPPRGTILEVLISTPDGELALNAEVVHVVDKQSSEAAGQPPGVGLAFVAVKPEQKRAIHQYVDGLADRLGPEEAPATAAATATPTIEPILQRARELITRAEDNDLYAALAVDASTATPEIHLRAQALKQQFTEAMNAATPPQLARLQAALKLLERAATLMASPARRLEYDFRHGEVRADQRIEQARQKVGPPVNELRLTWAKAFPERIERSMALAKAAFELRKGRDLIGAVRSGRQALELDPFHEELRQTVRAWTEMIAPKKDP